MHTIHPCLWFDGKAEEAANHYIGIFKTGRIKEVRRNGAAGPVFSVSFELDGKDFMALNGGPAFSFTPAISFFVTCETQDEVDHLWDGLLVGGKPMQCGWLTDKFGVSWQIVPRALGQLLQDPDRTKAARVMQAMMGMIKLDVAGLQRAYDGS